MQREGFGIRLGAALIDLVGLIIFAVAIPFIIGLVMGAYVATVLGAVLGLAYMSTEIFRAASPGKMLLKLQITDESGNSATREQLIRRFAFKQAGGVFNLVAAVTTLTFINYFGQLAGLVVLIGFFMVLKAQKQAWHDTFAKTAVCREAPAGFQVMPPPVPQNTEQAPAKQAA